MKTLIFTLCLTLAGCASAPHYEKMQTAEEKLSAEEDIKPGMMITKKGAVLDVSVEEVQAQKARIEKENGELKDQLKKLQADLDQERLKVLILKMAVPQRVPASE